MPSHSECSGIPTPPVTRMQAALVRIWRDLPTLRDPDLYEAWSYRVLLRACSDARRSARRSVPSIDITGIESPVVDSQSMVAHPRRARACLRDTESQPTRGPRAHVLRGPVGCGDRSIARHLRGHGEVAAPRRAQRAASRHRRRLATADSGGASSMTSDLDLDRILAAWLAEGPERAPDHDVAAALRRAARTSQRRARPRGGSVPSRGSRQDAGGRRRPSSWSPSLRRRPLVGSGSGLPAATVDRPERVRGGDHGSGAQLTSRSSPCCPPAHRRPPLARGHVRQRQPGRLGRSRTSRGPGAVGRAAAGRHARRTPTALTTPITVTVELRGLPRHRGAEPGCARRRRCRRDRAPRSASTDG